SRSMPMDRVRSPQESRVVWMPRPYTGADMGIEPGTHTLGPADGTLTVLTGRGGAAAKAGHDLTIEVTRWTAKIEAGEEIAMALMADPRSLRVVDGSGGIPPLG